MAGRCLGEQLREEADAAREERNKLLTGQTASGARCPLPEGPPPLRAPLTLLEAFNEAQAAERERSGHGSGAGLRESKPSSVGKPGSEVHAVPDRHMQPFLAYSEEFFRDLRMCDARLAPSDDPLSHPSFSFPHFSTLSPLSLSLSSPPPSSTFAPSMQLRERHSNTPQPQQQPQPDPHCMIKRETPSSSLEQPQLAPANASFLLRSESETAASTQHHSVPQTNESSVPGDPKAHGIFLISPPKLEPGDTLNDLCQVCWDGTISDDNPIIICEGCGVAVHRTCNSIKEVPSKWYCLGCRSEHQGKQRPVCALCPRTDGLLAPTTDGRYAHLFCAQWIPETCINEDEEEQRVDHINDVPKQRYNMKCSICKEVHGSCAQCSWGRCAASFHPICARYESDYRLELVERDDDSISFKHFCPKHSEPRAKQVEQQSNKKEQNNSFSEQQQQQQDPRHLHQALGTRASINANGVANGRTVEPTRRSPTKQKASQIKQQETANLHRVLGKRKLRTEAGDGSTCKVLKSMETVADENKMNESTEYEHTRQGHEAEKIPGKRQHTERHPSSTEPSKSPEASNLPSNGQRPLVQLDGLEDDQGQSQRERAHHHWPAQALSSEVALQSTQGLQQGQQPPSGQVDGACLQNDPTSALPLSNRDIQQAPLGSGYELTAHELEELVKAAIALGFEEMCSMDALLGEDVAAQLRAWIFNEDGINLSPNLGVAARQWIWSASQACQTSSTLHPMLDRILSQDADSGHNSKKQAGGWVEDILKKPGGVGSGGGNQAKRSGSDDRPPHPHARLHYFDADPSVLESRCTVCSALNYSAATCGYDEHAPAQCLRKHRAINAGRDQPGMSNAYGNESNYGERARPSSGGEHTVAKPPGTLRTKDDMISFLQMCNSRRKELAECPTDEVSTELVLHQAILARQVSENRSNWRRILQRVLENVECEKAKRDQRMEDVNEAAYYHARQKELKKQRQKAYAPADKRFQGGEEIEDKAVEDAALDEDARCVVCGFGDSDEPNEVLFCERCELAVHQRCYGVSQVPDGDWLCDPCTDLERKERENNTEDIASRPDRSLRTPGDGKRLDPRNQCRLCPVFRGAMKRDLDAKDPLGWMHVACALSHGETCHSATAPGKGITGSSRIPSYAWGAKCGVCSGRGGACVRCSEEGCSVSLHPLCARNAGLGFYVQRGSDGSVLGAGVRCHEHLKREDSMEQSPDRCESSGNKQKKRKLSDPPELQYAKYARHDFDRLRLLCTRMLKREYTMRACVEVTASMAAEALVVSDPQDSADSMESIWPGCFADSSADPLTQQLGDDLVEHLRNKRRENESKQAAGTMQLSPALAEAVQLPSGMKLEAMYEDG